jgi:hypothetical protein
MKGDVEYVILPPGGGQLAQTTANVRNGMHQLVDAVQIWDLVLVDQPLVAETRVLEVAMGHVNVGQIRDNMEIVGDCHLEMVMDFVNMGQIRGDVEIAGDLFQ